MSCLDGAGTTVLFGTSAFAAKVLSVDGPSHSRASIDCTHMATTGNSMEFIPATLKDPGSVDITFEFDGTVNPPIDAALETITIDWAGAGVGNKWSFSAFMTDFSPSASIGERMEASATLKVTGDITIA